MARFAWLNDFNDLRPGRETLHFAPAKSGPLFLLAFLFPQGVARARMTPSISRHFADVAPLSTTRRLREPITRKWRREALEALKMDSAT